MRQPLLTDDAHWRYFLLATLFSIRRTIREITLGLALMAGGLLLSGWWPQAPVAAVMAVVLNTTFAYLRDRSAQRTLEKQWLKAEAERASDLY